MNKAISAALTIAVAVSTAGADDPSAKTILEVSGFRGGVVVHVGCGDGKLTAGLCGDNVVVHGLDTNAGNVAKTRELLRRTKCYGTASAARFDGRNLPYADGVVNLLVMASGPSSPDRSAVASKWQVAGEEIQRVLAPRGVLVDLSDPTDLSDRLTRKPVPKDTDEWTHYLYDASNNAVSEDNAVGPPAGLQWVTAPKFSRSHEHLASLSAAVSAGGKVFSIEDHGPVESVAFPASWLLIARDAYNGVTLWTRELGPWEWHLREFRHGPPQVTRRLVAVGDRVYVTLSYGGPVEMLDAATGKTLKTSAGTEGTEEIIHAGKLLLFSVGDAKPATGKSARIGAPAGSPRRLLAVDAASGKTAWEKQVEALAPVTLGASGNTVFYQDGGCVVAAKLENGQKLWQSESLTAQGRKPAWFSPVVVAYEDMILWADGKMLTGLDAATGKTVWKGGSENNWHAPPDVLVSDGLVWTGKLRIHKQPGITQGLDPKTGEVKRTKPSDLQSFACGMTHHRCYRNKGTPQWLLLGRAGTEFLNVETGEIRPHHWVRGMCQYGVMPANGLLYATPHACACFLTAKINGFNALAPRREQGTGSGETGRLVKGPAYGSPIPQSAIIRNPKSDWPTYRHDAQRSGRASTKVAAGLRELWRTDVGKTLTAVTVARGMCFAADCDNHTVHALDAKIGKTAWSFTAGGRIDSPPTIADGLAVFGCRDGYVYCLRASDGELVWRFRAAPRDRRVIAYGQLESLWPVRGSVLVEDGAALFAAGRSSFLDGGIKLSRVDLKTGKLLKEATVYTPDPETHAQKRETVYGFNMYGALPDVMVSDGENIFMRQLCFTKDLDPAPVKPHLFSPTGLLDKSWWHRTYWVYGSTFTAGWPGWFQTGNKVPAGRVLAFDEERVYGFGRNQFSNRSRTAGANWAAQEAFHVFAADKTPKPAASEPAPAQAGKKRRGRGAPKKTFLWSQKADVRARAMVLTDGTVFFAGAPNLGNSSADAYAAMQGQKGAKLVAVSTVDGQKQTELDLPALPVLDGMAAAGGRLYVALRNGTVVCLGE